MATQHKQSNTSGPRAARGGSHRGAPAGDGRSDRAPRPTGPAGAGSQVARHHALGPTSSEGVEASDLPDGGRGNVDTDPGRELGRNVPQHTGEVVGSHINTDVGLGGHPDVRDADPEETLGRHQGDK